MSQSASVRPSTAQQRTWRHEAVAVLASVMYNHPAEFLHVAGFPLCVPFIVSSLVTYFERAHVTYTPLCFILCLLRLNPLQDRKLTIKQRYVVGGGTEPPFSGRFTNGVKYNTKRRGTFNCAVCDLPAYASSSKFKSGTGWPSFYEVCTYCL